MTVAGDISTFNPNAFSSWLAGVMQVSTSRIYFKSLSAGSVIAEVYVGEDPTSTVSSTTAVFSLQSLVNSNNPSVTQGTYAISKLAVATPSVTSSTSTSTTGGGTSAPFTSHWYFYLIVAVGGAALIAVVVIVIIVVRRRNKQVGYDYFKTDLEEGLLPNSDDFDDLYKQYENQTPNKTMRKKQKHEFIPLEDF